MVDGKRMAVILRNGVFGFQIGENVAAAEFVDGLLGIANHEEEMIGRLHEQRIENAILRLIRVLEFINNRTLEFLADCIR